MLSHPPQLPQSAKQIRRAMFVLYGPPIALLIIAGVQTRVPVSTLMRDPAAIAGLPSYTGALSNLGVLLWCATASVCLFAALVLTRVGSLPRERGLLLGAGLLSGVLMLDDLFQVHEVAARLLGVPDSLISAFYAALLAGLLLRFAPEIKRSNYALLLVALGFFALSLTVDALDPKALIGSRYHLLEDGPKLLGIVSWLGYYGAFSLQSLHSVLLSQSPAQFRAARSHTGSHE